MKTCRFLSMIGICLALSSRIGLCGQAVETYGYAVPETAAQREARLKWFKESRFGMFIHWGLYSSYGGEYQAEKDSCAWIMLHARIPLADYKARAASFNPTKFNARQWVQIAKNAGMKYIVITAKHHDGFCMYDSKLTDFNIAQATPFKRDPIAELAAECEKQGLVFCVYYSVRDWVETSFPSALNFGGFHSVKGNPGDINLYNDYMKGHIVELLSNYGPIGIVWFDGGLTLQDAPGADTLLATIRKLQPNCIVNERVGVPADYKTAESFLMLNNDKEELFETCMTMNNHWGYNKFDNSWKSTKELLSQMVNCASKGGNYLLNVGPTGEGVIPQESVDALAKIGEWMERNGESIYGTEASPLKEFAHGFATTKPGKIYLHVFDWPAGGKLLVPGLKNKIKNARFLADKKSLSAGNSAEGLVLDIPPTPPDALDSVIVLEIEGKPEISYAVLKNLALGATASSSSVATKDHRASHINDGNINSHWKAATSKQPGEWVALDFGKPITFNQVIVGTYDGGPRINRFKLQIAEGDTWCDCYIGGPLTQNVIMDVQQHRIRLPTAVTSSRLRLLFTDVQKEPLINEIEVFNSNISVSEK